METDRHELSRTIRQYRRRRGLSQADLAELLSIHPKTVSRWESGHRKPWPFHRHELERLFAE